MVRRADDLDRGIRTIRSCGDTWFNASMKMQSVPRCPRCDWRSVFQACLPPAPPPISAIARAKTRKKKKPVDQPAEEPKKPKHPRPPKPPPAKSKRIRIYPQREQKRKLANWFGVVRWTYNQAVSIIKANLWLVDFSSPDGDDANKKTTVAKSAKFIRQRCVTQGGPRCDAAPNRPRFLLGSCGPIVL